MFVLKNYKGMILWHLCSKAVNKFIPTKLSFEFSPVGFRKIRSWREKERRVIVDSITADKEKNNMSLQALVAKLTRGLRLRSTD